MRKVYKRAFSILNSILVGEIMCEFYLKGKCFHPKRVSRGQIATNCEAHACNDCTSASWQSKKVKDQLMQLKELIHLSNGTAPQFSEDEQAENMTKIFG